MTYVIPPNIIVRLIIVVSTALAPSYALAGSLPSSIPPLPKYEKLPIPEGAVAVKESGELEWLDAKWLRSDGQTNTTRCWNWELVLRRWNPGTALSTEVPLGVGGMVFRRISLPAGVMFLRTPDKCEGEAAKRIGWYAKGEILLGDIDKSVGEMDVRLLALGDDSAILVTREKLTRHVLAYVLRAEGKKVSAQRMPVLAVAYRNDFAAEVLDESRLMILGGSDAQYRGCSPCRAETYVLDIRRQAWEAGPMMIEPRSEHAATRLPDGSILVTGGWTSKSGWGPGPSRTAERWNPATNKFEPMAPMPTGTARHRGVWMPGQAGKTLLIVEGMSNSLPSFDVASASWYNAGAWWQGSEEGACSFLPFTVAGKAYAWHWYRTEGFYSSKTCDYRAAPYLSTLRTVRGKSATASPDDESLLVAYRSEAAFVPATADRPALLIGGKTHAGMNTYLVTSAVEAIDKDGHLLPMPSLNEARADARAFRLGDGVVVTGGHGGSIYDPKEQERALPVEWLPSSTTTLGARWTIIEGVGPAQGSAIGQMSDGSLLEIGSDRSVTQLRVVQENGIRRLSRLAWPSLDRARRSNESSRVEVRQLSDGRIIVAGGEVQAEKIALFDGGRQGKDSSSVDDVYIGIGPFLPSRRHEVFDPVLQRWRRSAPSSAAGGRVVILDDGRVLKIGAIDESSRTALENEISDENGGTWERWPLAPQPRISPDRELKYFFVDGELFASGKLEPIDTGGGPSGLAWLNRDAGQWELLWQAGEKDNWRDHVGRVVIRKINGKTVVLPVEGP